MLILVVLLFHGCAHVASPPYEVRSRTYGSCVTAAPRDSSLQVGDLIIGPGDAVDASVRASWGRALRTRSDERFDVVVLREGEPTSVSADRRRAFRQEASFEERRACEDRAREFGAQWRVEERIRRPEREAEARRALRQEAVAVRTSEWSAAPVQGHFVVRDGAPELFARRAFAGPDAPVVIVVNDGPGQSHDSLRVLETLADQGWTVVFYDQRGVGLSARPTGDEDYSLRAHADDLDAVRQWSGAEQAVVLGHAWGATLALDYAARYPAHVLGLALVGADAVHYRGVGARDPALVSTHTWAEVARFRRQIDPSCQVFARRVAHDYPRMSKLKPSHMAGKCSIEVRDLVRVGVGEFDLRPDMAEVSTPVLVWYGDGDAFHVHRSSIVDALAQAQVSEHEEPACGHRPMFQCPDRFYSVLVPFLDGLTD